MLLTHKSRSEVLMFGLLTNFALYCQSERAIKLSQFLIFNRSSEFIWNCGDANQNLYDIIKWTILKCVRKFLDRKLCNSCVPTGQFSALFYQDECWAPEGI